MSRTITASPASHVPTMSALRANFLRQQAHRVRTRASVARAEKMFAALMAHRANEIRISDAENFAPFVGTLVPY